MKTRVVSAWDSAVAARLRLISLALVALAGNRPYETLKSIGPT